jgi:signal peptidase I
MELLSAYLIIMFIAIFILCAIISLLLNGLLLWGISRLFKISNATFEKSLLIGFLSSLVTATSNIIFTLIGLGIVGSILAVIIGFFVLYYFYKKYYSASVGKCVGIYVVNIIIGVVIGLAIILPIRLFVSEPFVVSGDSMSPHLNKGDYIIINKYDRSYKRDDVIVFRSQNNNAYLIKRIVGLSSEKIIIKDGSLQINGVAVQNAYIATPIQGDVNTTLKADEYFVLSDNSAPSLDSRTFGPVNFSQIVGKVADQ